jgi:hypothetical protein
MTATESLIGKTGILMLPDRANGRGHTPQVAPRVRIIASKTACGTTHVLVKPTDGERTAWYALNSLVLDR